MAHAQTRVLGWQGVVKGKVREVIGEKKEA